MRISGNEMLCWDVAEAGLEDFYSRNQQEGPSGVEDADRSGDESESEPNAKKPKMTLWLTLSSSGLFRKSCTLCTCDICSVWTFI